MKKSLKQKLALLLAIIMMFTMSVPFGVIAGAADDVTDPPAVGDGEGEGEEPVDPPAPTAAEPLTDDVTDKVDVNSVTSSSDGFANEGAGNLFSTAYNTKFCGNTTLPGSPLVFSWTMTEAVAVQTYALTSAADASKYSDRDPKDFTLYGSNDGVEWTALDSRANQGFGKDNLTKVYAFENTTAYSQYKLEISASNGNAMVQVCAIQLSTASLKDQDADVETAKAAAAFDEKLAAFGGLNDSNYSEETYAEYRNLLAEYNALDTATKSLVKNVKVLTDSQTYIDTMGLVVVLQGLLTDIQAGLDKAAADSVNPDYHINGMITDAVSIYNGLSADQQKDFDMSKVDAWRAAMEPVNSQFSVTVGNLNTAGATKNPWIVDMTEEEIEATKQAVVDELKYQYTQLGYTLGSYENGGTVNLESGWGNMLLSQLEGGDNVTNPWRDSQTGRKWAAVMVPFAGMAFSATGYMGATDAGFTVLSDNFVYNGRVYQQRWDRVLSYAYGYEAPHQGDNTDYVLNPSLTTSNSYPGYNGSSDITKNSFRYAYAKYNTDNKLDGKVLGIPSGNAVVSDGVVYQAFEGPDGIAYIAAGEAAIAVADANSPAGTAFAISGDILDAIVGDDDFATAIAVTGAPITGVDADGVQLFENGVATKDGFKEYDASNEYLKVIVMIDKLPTGVTPETYETVGAALEAAQAAYNALTANKDKVSNVEDMNTLKAAYDKLAVDMKAAADVEELIDAIGTVTLESEADIKAADDAYTALTAEQKALVNNYAVLNSAKAALQRLIDEKAIKEVEDMILALPENEDIDGDKLAAAAEQIDAALAAYDKLSSSQKNGVAIDLLNELDTKKEIADVGGYEKWLEINSKPTGDVDGNGTVNVSDIMTLKNLIMNSSCTPEQLKAGDMNQDGTLTVGDMLSIKSVIMGG